MAVCFEPIEIFYPHNPPNYIYAFGLILNVNKNVPRILLSQDSRHISLRRRFENDCRFRRILCTFCFSRTFGILRRHSRRFGNLRIGACKRLYIPCRAISLIIAILHVIPIQVCGRAQYIDRRAALQFVYRACGRAGRFAHVKLAGRDGALIGNAGYVAGAGRCGCGRYGRGRSRSGGGRCGRRFGRSGRTEIQIL